jgi:protein required for attachment to host cells
MKAVRTWIVIADGANARVLLNTGPGKGVSEMEHLDISVDHAPNREILSDRQGRSFDSHGSGKHAMESASDPHRENKRAFAVHIVSLLSDELQKRSFDGLVLVAAPAFLGDLRSAMPNNLKSVLKGELAKDLTHEPIHTMESFLQPVINV